MGISLIISIRCICRFAQRWQAVDDISNLLCRVGFITMQIPLTLAVSFILTMSGYVQMLT